MVMRFSLSSDHFGEAPKVSHLYSPGFKLLKFIKMGKLRFRIKTAWLVHHDVSEKADVRLETQPPSTPACVSSICPNLQGPWDQARIKNGLFYTTCLFAYFDFLRQGLPV